jgi:hypothetical protein
MIKVKYASLDTSKPPVDIPIIPGETLDSAVKRSLENIPLEVDIKEVFQALVNGLRVESKFWHTTILKESDTIIICPVIRGDDPGSIARLVIVIAAVAVGAGPLGALIGGTAGVGIATAVISIGTSLLLNGLIPPPVPHQDAYGDSGISESQMYSLSGQSNQVKRFGLVPKVYGLHRMFPNVVGNPYIELETDPDTGQLSQYLYVLYDFGLGPMFVSDLLIGDSPIDQFSDISYNFVDLNKPAVSEGLWDDYLKDDFEIYKADVNSQNLSVVLDNNRDVGSPPLDSYQMIRTAAANPSNLDQGLTITVANPRGLVAYDAVGNARERGIDLEVHFSKAGEDNWKAYNDLDHVKDFSVQGGNQAYLAADIELFPLSFVPPSYPFVETFSVSNLYSLTVPARLVHAPVGAGDYIFPGPPLQYNVQYANFYDYGILKGATSFVAKPISGAGPGSVVNFSSFMASTYGQGNTAGATVTVTGVSAYGPDPSYNVYSCTPFPVSVTLFEISTGSPLGSGPNNSLSVFAYRIVADNNIGRASLSTTILGRVRITKAVTSQTFTTIKFNPKEIGQFKVRVVRTNSFSSVNNVVQDSLVVANLFTRFAAPPVLTTKRHVFLEMRIRSTNQLNGTIQNLSGTCRSVLETFDGTNWVKQVSSNPAWVFTDLLIGEVNKRPIDKSRLDTTSLLEWANYCDAIPTAPPTYDPFFAPRFQCNFILDYQTTLQQVLTQVSASAQASLNIVDGKYGVLIDRLKTTPVQIFTPRNSKGFSSVRSYTNKPHALSIKYLEPNLNWEATEEVVYDTGYDESNAVNIEELTGFGITNHEQAWRFGRFMLAQNRLRQELISIQVDFEHLVCTRGDYVQITQDVMKVGGAPARVRAVSGNQVTIDDGIETSMSLDYGYVFRAADGTISQGTLTPIDSDTFALDDDIPAIGDLIVIGEVGQEVFDCIVKSINPNDDLSANLTLVEKADAIYDAESTGDLPIYDPQISQTVDAEFAPNEVDDLLVVDMTFECFGTGYRYYVDLDWEAPLGSAFEAYEVYANSGIGYNLISVTRQSFYRYYVDETYLGVPHAFKVLAVSSTGAKLDLAAVAEVSATPVLKITPPSDVAGLNTDITGEVLQLFWPQIEDCDVREYLLRYSPTLVGTWETSIPLLRADRTATLAATQARTGTYLIKAVDFNGNESVNAAVAITSVPSLFNLNVVETITDFPTLPGPLDRAVKDGDTLKLAVEIPGTPDTQQFYSEGFYYYQNLLDLGDIFTIRLQSLIQAEGYTENDVMSNWLTLDSVTKLANSKFSEWDVETQYRSTNVFDVIENWTTLDSVPAMATGDEDDFTPWRTFFIGDATGRIFQFRLRLISNKPSVSPRVFDGTITADMPDRLEKYTNRVSHVTNGYVMTYAPAFYGPGTTPSVQISLENGQAGDYWTFENKNLEGFTVKFFDIGDNPVSRQFDAHVAGYGRKYTSVI